MKNLVTVELHPGFVIRLKATGLPEGGTGVRLSRLACQRLADALHAAAEQGAKAGSVFIVGGEKAPDVALRHTVVRLDESGKRAGVVYLDPAPKRRRVVRL